MTNTESETGSGLGQNGQPVHVCILGPSGVGKSPLAALFRLPGLDPLRVRKPRDEKDRLVCISEPDAIELFRSDLSDSSVQWPTPKAADDWFVLGERWLFFSVRGDKQCLRFKDDDNRQVLRSQKRIEIFARRLLDILVDNGSRSALGLCLDNLVLLLLNPSAKNYSNMGNSPDKDLRQSTFYAITKRTELQRKPVDVPDAQKRVRRIPEELAAWVQIKKTLGKSCVEFTSWQHFEFWYLQPDGSPADARRELLSARDTVLARLYDRAKDSPAVDRLLHSDVVRSPAEILELTDIV